MQKPVDFEIGICYNPIMKNKQGFTLIELVLTLAVLNIVMIPLFRFLFFSIDTYKMMQEQQEATMTMQGYMEELKGSSQYYNDLLVDTKHFWTGPDDIVVIIEPVSFYAFDDECLIYKITLKKEGLYKSYEIKGTLLNLEW